MTRAVGILGLGHYVPEKIITNTDMEKIVETSDEWITERTGIKQRHIAAPEEATSDLAYNAAVEALKDAGVAPEELDLVIVGTASSDYIFRPLPAWYRLVWVLKTQLRLTWLQAAAVLFTALL